MTAPVLTTKLFIPPPGVNTVTRPRLLEKLAGAKNYRLILLSASAGFGKTTLLSEWLSREKAKAAWVSLDREHNGTARFFTYFIAALQTLHPGFGAEILETLQSPDPPRGDLILVHLINLISSFTEPFYLVLDDYHVLDSPELDTLMGTLIDNMPSSMHLVVSSREDPQFPLSRLRARGQLLEIRVSDLKFRGDEIADYLNGRVGLGLEGSQLEALETRSEGWITGLQLAAISLKDHEDREEFIRSFTGSHRFILDYLVEEVLEHQPPGIQTFLIRTSLLDRMCGPLCSSLLDLPEGRGQEVLEILDQSNIFLIPLDEERRWYRYHHLFAGLLRMRLKAEQPESDALAEGLHRRASRWFEENKLPLEAFHHAVKAKDLEASVRLIEGSGIPRTNRGVVKIILDWLESLPEETRDQRPLLHVTHGSVLLGLGQVSGVEEILSKGETALNSLPTDSENRDLHGRIASMRGILAVTRYDSRGMKEQSHRALEYLDPANLSARTTACWSLGQALEMEGDRDEAEKWYREAVGMGMTSGNILFAILSEAGLGEIHESRNLLGQAEEYYRSVLEKTGAQPLPVMCDVYLGLSRICYQRNDLQPARESAETGLLLAEKFEGVIDRSLVARFHLARVYTAMGDFTRAGVILTEAAEKTEQESFRHRRAGLVREKIHLCLCSGQVEAASLLADEYALPFEQTRIALIRGEYEKALRLTETLLRPQDSRMKEDEKLRIMVLRGMCLYYGGDRTEGLMMIRSALETALPEGLDRIFLDEGQLMRPVLETVQQISGDILPGLIRLLDHFDSAGDGKGEEASVLSDREMEVLLLIAEGLTNREIGERLFVALDTVKGHNRRIFEKLEVTTRTAAVGRARALGLI